MSAQVSSRNLRTAASSSLEIRLCRSSCAEIRVRAVKGMAWPGEATIEVSVIWLGRSRDQDQRILDGAAVRAITPTLDPVGVVTGVPNRLAANAGAAFIGTYPLGMGFAMPPDEAYELIARDERNARVLFPYLNGEDLNSRPDCSGSRWIINFRDWPLELAEQYPLCLDRVARLVKPERLSNADRKRREVWWQFTRPTLELYRAIKDLDRVLIIALTSRTMMPTFVAAGQVYSQETVVFPTSDAAALSLRSS